MLAPYSEAGDRLFQLVVGAFLAAMSRASWSRCSQQCQSLRLGAGQSHIFGYDDEGDRVQMKAGADDGRHVKDVVIPKGRSATAALLLTYTTAPRVWARRSLKAQYSLACMLKSVP